MTKVVVNIENPSDVELFVKFLEHLSFVKSVDVEEKEYDWLNPSRPATEEEAEQMIADAEKGPSYTREEAEKLTLDELAKWREKKIKLKNKIPAV